MELKFKMNSISLQSIILLCMFLATLNTVNRYYYFVFIGFGIFLLGVNRKIPMNISLFALFVLAISLLTFSPNYSYSILGILKPFTYLMCYVMGFGLYEYGNVDNNKSLKPLFLIFSFVIAGPLVHYILNWMINYSSYTSRNTIDFWTKTELSATGQAAFACMALALAVACIFSDAGKKIKVVSALTITAVLGYNLILSGRTLILQGAIIFFIAFIHKYRNQKNEKAKYVIITLLVIALIFAIFYFDIFGVRSFIESSQLYDRFYGENAAEDVGSDGRMRRKMLYLKNIIDYPFGGSNIREMFGYAHDIFLDTYDEASVFALLAMLIYIAETMIRMTRCMKKKVLPFELRQIVLCTYIALYMQFMTEPVLQGMPWLFASFCIIDGGVSRIVSESEKSLLRRRLYESNRH